MNRHPDFMNPSRLGTQVLRQDRWAIAHRSVLVQGDLFRIFLGASSERHAAAVFGASRRRGTNPGPLQAAFDRFVAALPLLNVDRHTPERVAGNLECEEAAIRTMRRTGVEMD